MIKSKQKFEYTYFIGVDLNPFHIRLNNAFQTVQIKRELNSSLSVNPVRVLSRPAAAARWPVGASVCACVRVQCAGGAAEKVTVERRC